MIFLTLPVLHSYPVERKAGAAVHLISVNVSPVCLLSGCYELSHFFN